MIGGDVGLDLDVPTFLAALDSYETAAGIDHTDGLNHAIRNVAYQTAHFTPAASARAIKADLKKNAHLVYALTSLDLKRRGIGMLKSPEFATAVEKFINRRSASARYLRAAFAEAVQQLGGEWRGRKFRRGASGFANEATSSNLVAEIVGILDQPDAGHAASAEQVGLDALQKAFVFVAEDLVAYTSRKMAETAAAHSG